MEAEAQISPAVDVSFKFNDYPSMSRHYSIQLSIAKLISYVGKIAYVKTRDLTLIANLVASATALRLIKHVLLGPIQFINIPCIFAIISGALFGPIHGLIVGFMIFIVSDVFLGLGLWSIVTSSLCGIIGFISGIIWRNGLPSRVEALITSYFLLLFYDVFSSFLLYLPLMPPFEALITGIVGLFIPVMGGSLYAVGPVTEFSSAFVASIVMLKIGGVIRRWRVGDFDFT